MTFAGDRMSKRRWDKESTLTPTNACRHTIIRGQSAIKYASLDWLIYASISFFPRLKALSIRKSLSSSDWFDFWNDTFVSTVALGLNRIVATKPWHCISSQIERVQLMSVNSSSLIDGRHYGGTSRKKSRWEMNFVCLSFIIVSCSRWSINNRNHHVWRAECFIFERR